MPKVLLELDNSEEAGILGALFALGVGVSNGEEATINRLVSQVLAVEAIYGQDAFQRVIDKVKAAMGASGWTLKTPITVECSHCRCDGPICCFCGQPKEAPDAAHVR